MAIPMSKLKFNNVFLCKASYIDRAVSSRRRPRPSNCRDHGISRRVPVRIKTPTTGGRVPHAISPCAAGVRTPDHLNSRESLGRADPPFLSVSAGRIWFRLSLYRTEAIFLPKIAEQIVQFRHR